MDQPNEYTDLLYFGYEYNKESAGLQADFITNIKKKFENVELRDAYDSIKGYRQEVFLREDQNDDYYAWLIGDGWFEMSLTMQLIMLSAGREPEQKAKFDKHLALAKQQYPEAFKPEALSGK
jgi:hypothetical protein